MGCNGGFSAHALGNGNDEADCWICVVDCDEVAVNCGDGVLVCGKGAFIEGGIEL